jgi:hypothetical protein
MHHTIPVAVQGERSKGYTVVRRKSRRKIHNRVWARDVG